MSQIPLDSRLLIPISILSSPSFHFGTSLGQKVGNADQWAYDGGGAEGAEK